MSLMAWNDGLSVKVQQFDSQHKVLVAIINELHDSMKAGNSTEIIGSMLDRLISYTATHFTEEEQLMDSHGYPDAVAHKAAHECLIHQVLELQQMFKTGKSILTLDVMMFLRDWLMGHIQVVDKKYGAFLNSKGVA
jgi:hemerythrin-like metal-binding protein